MKKEEKQNEIKMAEPVTISNTPTEIDFSNIEIKQGDCFINSYRVAKKYPQVEIVEGLILAIDIENGAKPMPHVWNKLGDIHFDVTKEKVWNGREELKETKEIKYFSVKFHSHTDFKNGDLFEFCFDTDENVQAIKNFLNNSGKESKDE
ncbi:MAG TPA: hypothetical protein VKZ97_06485 [Flavobacteriaceae bacterium]|nr:hypothetical protein [Flavobacteriaceae bacterium]